MQKITRIIYPLGILFLLITGCRQKDTEPADNAGLYLPDDLQAELWAESPMFYNPTNIDVDAKGRIWVTEAVNYRNYNNDSTAYFHHKDGDRIIILEDTDQDGKADTSITYVQDKDLRSPVGLAVIGNKVIVSCSPNLIVYTDENGDDHPDKKEILLTGFGGYDHDHSLHAVFGGPDGRWYFNTGNAGPHMVTDKSGYTLRSGSIYTGGSPYNQVNKSDLVSDDGRKWVGGLALSVNPDGTGLKVMGHNFRNSYEVFIDSYGDLWQNDNDDQVLTCRATWLMEGGNAGFFSTDGSRYWQADQRPGQDIFTAHWHQEDPGVMPAGDQTGAGSPTGFARIETEALGEKYRGMLLSADAGRNVVFGFIPRQDKSGFDLGQRQNFITSLKTDNELYVWNDSAQNAKRDMWFRPSDVTVGTDGAIYVADWYDPVVGGHQMKDSTGYGRIYRISPKNKKLKVPAIDFTTTSGLLEGLKNPAIHVRYVAAVKLREKGAAVINEVKNLLGDDNEFVRARAVWVLAGLGEPGSRETEKLLDDPDTRIRATAFRALRRTGEDIYPLAEKLSADKDPFIRREVAVALRDSPFVRSKTILHKLAQSYTSGDRWFLETLGAAMDKEAAYWYDTLKTLLAKDLQPEQWPAEMADFAWRLHPRGAIGDISRRVTSATLDNRERKRMATALAFVNDPAAANQMILFSASGDKDLAETATYWLSFRQSNDWAKLVDWSKVKMNTAYERKLASMKVKMQIILDERQSEYEHRSKIRDMALDSVGGQMLLGLAEENKLSEKNKRFVENYIFKNPDATIRVQAGKYFTPPGSKTNYSIDKIGSLTGNSANGKKVFMASCATCHRFGKEGGSIGPELTAIAGKFTKPVLLDAIINPDGAIVFGYETWLANTKDGQSVYGFLLSQNKNSVVIKDISGNKHVLKPEDITTLKKQDKGLMPDPGTMNLTEQDLADVVTYLGSR